MYFTPIAKEMSFMNYIWSGMIIISLVFAAINGTLDETLAAAFSGAEQAAGSVIAMAGIFCFWSGFLKIAESGGFSGIISKLMRPVLHRIFPRLSTDSKAYSAITMNVTANLLGLGNAATPAGIEAVEELDRINGSSPFPSEEMCLFIVMNTASIQVIPTTVTALRAAAGSAAPSEIMLPMWIVSAVSLISAFLAMKLILKCRRVLPRGQS